RRALAGTGDAGQQDHPLRVHAELVQAIGQVKAFEVGNEVIYAAGDHPKAAHLLQDVDAESPALVVDPQRVSEVDAALLFKDFATRGIVAERRQDKPGHFVVVDRPPIEPSQVTFNAHDRWSSHFQVQVAPFELDQGPEELVDLQLLVVRKTTELDR